MFLRYCKTSHKINNQTHFHSVYQHQIILLIHLLLFLLLSHVTSPVVECSTPYSNLGVPGTATTLCKLIRCAWVETSAVMPGNRMHFNTTSLFVFSLGSSLERRKIHQFCDRKNLNRFIRKIETVKTILRD